MRRGKNFKNRITPNVGDYVEQPECSHTYPVCTGPSYLHTVNHHRDHLAGSLGRSAGTRHVTRNSALDICPRKQWKKNVSRKIPVWPRWQWVYVKYSPGGNSPHVYPRVSGYTTRGLFLQCKAAQLPKTTYNNAHGGVYKPGDVTLNKRGHTQKTAQDSSVVHGQTGQALRPLPWRAEAGLGGKELSVHVNPCASWLPWIDTWHAHQTGPDRSVHFAACARYLYLKIIAYAVCLTSSHRKTRRVCRIK